MLIDSHCHLDHFADDEVGALLDRARAAGLGGMVTIGTRLSAAPLNRRLTRHARPDLAVWCTIGTHPDHVADEAVPDPDRLAAMASAPEIVGIGESGLDYFHGEPTVRPSVRISARPGSPTCRWSSMPGTRTTTWRPS